MTARKLVAINVVPYPAGPRPNRGPCMPETGMDESKMDPAYREAIHAVWESVLPEPGWALEFVLDMPDPRWSGDLRRQHCWLLAPTSMLASLGWSRVQLAATA